MTCYGCSSILADVNLRLCNICRQEHAKLEAPYLAGYIDWECKFVPSRKGSGHKFPYQENIKWMWFRIFTKTKNKWREV